MSSLNYCCCCSCPWQGLTARRAPAGAQFVLLSCTRKDTYYYYYYVNLLWRHVLSALNNSINSVLFNLFQIPGFTTTHNQYGPGEFGDPWGSHRHWPGLGGSRDNCRLSVLSGEATGQGVGTAGGGQAAQPVLFQGGLCTGIYKQNWEIPKQIEQKYLEFYSLPLNRNTITRRLHRNFISVAYWTWGPPPPSFTFQFNSGDSYKHLNCYGRVAERRPEQQRASPVCEIESFSTGPAQQAGPRPVTVGCSVRLVHLNSRSLCIRCKKPIPGIIDWIEIGCL